MMAEMTAKTTTELPAWVHAWREGIAPCILTESLYKLREALISDDQRLIQGSTTTPPPLMCVQDWPVEAACAISYCGWQSGLTTVGAVDLYFAAVCFEADQRLGEPGGCRRFLNWYDDTERQKMRESLIEEVEHTLAEREGR